MGANVSWGESTQSVTIKKDNIVVVLHIGKKVIVVNGKEIPMDIAPIIRDGRTYLPANNVAEAFGHTVDWDSVTKTVKISIK
jgi:N-acetylmuramoyl-L-alanine amidase